MLSFIQTHDGIHTVLNGRMRTISSGDPHYADVLEAIKKGADDAAILDILDRELHRMEAAVEALNKDLTDDVQIRGGQVLFRGTEVHNSLTDRMLSQLNEGFDLVPMARFLSNLMENPSYRAVNDLYTFLEYGKMPITEDGCFLAYKAVRADYKDIHSGTFDNTPGRPDPIEMPRNMVNEDPEQTCSSGLHVCSFEYLPSFAHANGHVVVCKVNPRDVVAIPKDYHNTKMRVCRYWVVGEYENYYGKPEDRLSQVSIATEGKPFRVEVFGSEPDVEMFDRLSEASRRAEELLSYESTEKVTITNAKTGVLIDEQVNDDFVGYDDPDDEDDEDGGWEEADSFKVVVYQTKADLDANRGTLFAEGIDDLSDARDEMMDAYRQESPFAVQVIDENTGEVKHTFS